MSILIVAHMSGACLPFLTVAHTSGARLTFLSKDMGDEQALLDFART